VNMTSWAYLLILNVLFCSLTVDSLSPARHHVHQAVLRKLGIIPGKIMVDNGRQMKKLQYHDVSVRLRMRGTVRDGHGHHPEDEVKPPDEDEDSASISNDDADGETGYIDDYDTEESAFHTLPPGIDDPNPESDDNDKSSGGGDDDDADTAGEYFIPLHGPWHCKQNQSRVATLASDYYGKHDKLSYIDSHLMFFKYALGLSNDDEMMESLDEALKHFKHQFGLNFAHSAAKSIVTEGKSYAHDKVSNLTLYPFVMSEALRVVASSSEAIHCANTTAVLGGWVVEGKDVLVKGDLHPEGKLYNDDVSFVQPYLAVMPGTRSSTRVIMYPVYPLYCPHTGACALSGPYHNFDDDVQGWFDGLSLYYDFGPRHDLTNIIRLNFMEPGRFTPLPNGN